jgi:hypothetical protein
MSEPIPILEGDRLSAEDKRLLALFDKMESDQIEFLDAAGKRIIELSSAMLGLLFAVTAFGKDFPPPYLANNATAKQLAVATLLLYVLALLAGVFVVQPRRYARHHYNLSAMRTELDRIVRYKSHTFQVAVAIFVIGSVALASLVGTILLK